MTRVIQAFKNGLHDGYRDWLSPFRALHQAAAQLCEGIWPGKL